MYNSTYMFNIILCTCVGMFIYSIRFFILPSWFDQSKNFLNFLSAASFSNSLTVQTMSQLQHNAGNPLSGSLMNHFGGSLGGAVSNSVAGKQTEGVSCLDLRYHYSNTIDTCLKNLCCILVRKHLCACCILFSCECILLLLFRYEMFVFFIRLSLYLGYDFVLFPMLIQSC